MKLAGHHALITGGGTGIGAAIAQALASEGAKVSIIGRRVGPLKETAAALAAQGFPDIFFTTTDVTEENRVKAAIGAARDRNGRISILVNNAGAAPSAPFAKVTAESWRQTMAVNLDALFYCTQEVLHGMIQAGEGRVITIASTAGLKGYGYVAPYVAAKHGAVGLMRALAAEYAKTPLTFNAICPGFTDTDLVAAAADVIVKKTGRTAEQARADLARFNPQGRLIDPREVASTVLWLCLPEQRSVTGQAIAVDGGETG
jgi:NAD(P)-dependent dehydrogenase (short-subunit alcohol dehydrogenase family)